MGHGTYDTHYPQRFAGCKRLASLTGTQKTPTTTGDRGFYAKIRAQNWRGPQAFRSTERNQSQSRGVGQRPRRSL